MHETQPAHATTEAGPEPDRVDAGASRARRRVLLWLVPFLLLGAARTVLAAHTNGVLVAAVSYVAALGFAAAVIAACAAAWHRGVRQLAAEAGPGAWAARCVDVRRPELWRAVVADAAGVRLVGDRRGTPVTTWSWAEIHDVRVEKATVADRSGHVVVLALGSGATVPLGFLVFSVLGYPRRRAEAIAERLRRQVPEGTTTAGRQPRAAAPAVSQPGADRPAPTPLPGPSGERLQLRGHLLAGVAVVVLLPSFVFEHYLPGGIRTELVTFVPAGGLAFVIGYAVVFAGMRKGRREVDRGYTTDFQTAGWDQTLFLLDWRDLSVLSGPFQPRPEKLPRGRQPAGLTARPASPVRRQPTRSRAS